MFDTLPSSSNSSLQVVHDQHAETPCAASVSRRIRNGDAQQGLTLLLTVSILQLGRVRHTRGVLYLSKRDATRLVRFGAPRVFIYSLYIHCVVCVTRCRLCVEGFWLCCLSQCSLYRPKRRLAHGSSPASRSRLSVSQCSVVTRVYWCTFPSPATSFLAREKAFLRAFFCQSGTVRIPCLRSLCTYNFLKSVHFGPRLAVYHPLFDCFEHMFTV